MKIHCVGAGPAGLWFAIAAMTYDPGHDVTVFERRPPGTTYGWGIVYWDDLLDGASRVDPAAARAIRDGSIRWAGQRVCVQGRRPVHLGGTGYGMGRQRLIDVLAQRARDLGVRIEYERDVADTADLPDAELVVAADGAGSRLRRHRPETFGTTETTGTNRHLWLGSAHPFPDFTFAFEDTRAGWIWFHAYRYAPQASTVIVECREETWRGLGFGPVADEACLEELERIFARHLDGHQLRPDPNATEGTRWTSFTTVSNARWHAGDVVLLGDAAHTAHFSIGSGTRMAFEDAAALARAVAGCTSADLPVALQRYQDERIPAVLALQQHAAASARWFQDVDDHVRLPPLHFGYSLRMRRDPQPRSALLLTLHRATQWKLGRLARRMVAQGRRMTAGSQPARRPRAR